jgi:hypothetical protein
MSINDHFAKLDEEGKRSFLDENFTDVDLGKILQASGIDGTNAAQKQQKVTAILDTDQALVIPEDVEIPAHLKQTIAEIQRLQDELALQNAQPPPPPDQNAAFMQMMQLMQAQAAKAATQAADREERMQTQAAQAATQAAE